VSDVSTSVGSIRSGQIDCEGYWGEYGFKVDDAGAVQAAKVGIGTTNPQATLHAVETSTASNRGFMTVQHNDGAQRPTCFLENQEEQKHHQPLC